MHQDPRPLLVDARPADAVKPRSARDPPTLLTFDTLPGYLAARGFLTAQHVEGTDEGALRILDYSSRNRIFKVVFAEGKGLLVKQGASHQDGGLQDSVALEADLLRAVRADDALRPLRWCAPRPVHFDRTNMVLVTELVHPATTFSKYHLNAGDIHFPRDSAATGARILAAFHRAGGRALRAGRLPSVPRRRPFVWDARTVLEKETRGQDAGPRVRLHAQLRDAHFWAGIPRLAEEWDRHAQLVHSDPRWDNFLLTSGPGPRDDLNVRLIDWEFACVGDAAWDVAYFLCEYLRFWIFFSPQSPNVASLEALERQARFLPAGWHEATEHFWATYRKAARLSPQASEEMLARVRSYLPFNLTLIAYESLRGAGVRPWGPVLAFELATQAAEDPEAFLDRWIGALSPRRDALG